MEKLFKFHWPHINDSLYNRNFNSLNDCNMEYYFDKEYSYASGYKNASELIIELTINNQEIDKSSLIFPSLFLFHHHIELRLKRIISIYYSHKRINSKIRLIHEILDLWNEAENYIIEINSNFDTEPVISVRKIIKELDNLSKSSEGYRYSRNKKNIMTIQNNHIINLENLLQIIQNVNTFLDCVEAQFEDLKSSD